jgi:hypothetical protein
MAILDNAQPIMGVAAPKLMGVAAFKKCFARKHPILDTPLI